MISSVGWAQPLSLDAPPANKPVVCLISAHDFPEPGLIDSVIRSGLTRDPSTVFVMRDRDKAVGEAMSRTGVDPVIVILNPYFKYAKGEKQVDDRSIVRDSEIVQLCSRVIVFRTPQTNTLDFYADERWSDKVRVLERGEKKAKRYRKGKALV